ncbi:MAG TPA: hypothetical protein VK638_24010 [Edaphobacter sp.]|nr:hypothetical protein [Edaphobacter sp.]
MPDEVMTREALSKTFITLVLFTGSSNRAEKAILDGIRSLSLGAEPRTELLRKSLAAALEAEGQQPPLRSDDLEETSAMLCRGLRPLLGLPAHLRKCFVMRFLANISREHCAGLLHCDVADIDELTVSALQLFARVAPREERAIAR